MTLSDHHEYYVERAATARAMAARAAEPLIAKIHEDFAVRYDVAANLAGAMSQRTVANKRRQG